MGTSRRFGLSLLVVVAWLLFVGRARAQAEPWFDAGNRPLEDRYADGDLDDEDIALLEAHAGRGSGVGSSDVRGKTWVTLLGFTTEFMTGRHAIGGMVVFGIALDRVVQGAHTARERAPAFVGDGPPPSPPFRGAPPAFALPSATIDPGLARGAVRAAWRIAGIEATDARVDAMIARARRSAMLPETRLRAMRVLNGGDQATTYVDSSGKVYDTVGASLSLEARLTWHLNRLVYADDEPTLEHLRLERQDARARLGTRVLELMFGWQRALFDLAASTYGSRAELEAVLRKCESEIALDVLTEGWFGAQPAVKSASSTRGAP